MPKYSEDAPMPPTEDRPNSPASTSSSGAVHFGDILAKVSIRPTQAMLDQAAAAGVPGSTDPLPNDDEPYDPIAIASYWAGLGYKVMPLKSMAEVRRGGFPDDQAGKIPSFKGKQYEQGTTDPELIKRWWSDDPGRGVGLPTQANRLLVVDVDNGFRLFGELAFMEMAEEIGLDVTEVPMSKSPSYHGGYHLYYRLPRTAPQLSLPAVSVIAKNVDLPWFVVAPGSWKYTTVDIDRHEKAIKGIGIQTWHAGDPADIPVAPRTLMEKLMRRGVPKGSIAVEASSAIRGSYRTGAGGFIDIEHHEANGIPLGLEHGQNGALYRIACKLAGRWMDVPEYEAVERCWAIISKSPYKSHKGPWTFEQVEKLVRGAYEWVAEDNEAKDEIVANLRKKGLVK